jgi:hypothetical protein
VYFFRGLAMELFAVPSHRRDAAYFDSKGVLTRPRARPKTQRKYPKLKSRGDFTDEALFFIEYSADRFLRCPNLELETDRFRLPANFDRYRNSFYPVHNRKLR